MTIFIGADHRGFELKEKIKQWLKEQGHDVTDCGNNNYDPEDDYVEFAEQVAKKIAQSEPTFGILLCGSGIGMSIVANRYKGVRCGLGFNIEQVKHGRENDHINCLSIASDYVDFEKGKEMIGVLLHSAPKREEKYLRRVEKIDK